MTPEEVDSGIGAFFSCRSCRGVRGFGRFVCLFIHVCGRMTCVDATASTDYLGPLKILTFGLSKALFVLVGRFVVVTCACRSLGLKPISKGATMNLNCEGLQLRQLKIVGESHRDGD